MYSGTNQDPGHEEETFHPKINQRSKEMGRGRYLKGTKSVHNRLYSEAVDTTERQQQVRRRGNEEDEEGSHTPCLLCCLLWCAAVVCCGV